MDGAEKQAEAQRKQLRQTEANLAIVRDQVKILSKKLKEVEKAKDQAEQDGYEVREANTKNALKAELSKVCRYYYLQV